MEIMWNKETGKEADATRINKSRINNFTNQHPPEYHSGWDEENDCWIEDSKTSIQCKRAKEYWTKANQMDAIFKAFSFLQTKKDFTFPKDVTDWLNSCKKAKSDNPL